MGGRPDRVAGQQRLVLLLRPPPSMRPVTGVELGDTAARVGDGGLGDLDAGAGPRLGQTGQHPAPRRHPAPLGVGAEQQIRRVGYRQDRGERASVRVVHHAHPGGRVGEHSQRRRVARQRQRPRRAGPVDLRPVLGLADHLPAGESRDGRHPFHRVLAADPERTRPPGTVRRTQHRRAGRPRPSPTASRPVPPARRRRQRRAAKRRTRAAPREWNAGRSVPLPDRTNR